MRRRILPYVYLERPDQKIKWNVWSFDEGSTRTHARPQAAHANACTAPAEARALQAWRVGFPMKVQPGPGPVAQVVCRVHCAARPCHHDGYARRHPRSGSGCAAAAAPAADSRAASCPTEHNFMVSPEGRTNFQNQLKQLIGSIQYSNDYDVHTALILAPSYAKTIDEKYYQQDKNVWQRCREYVDLFGIMQKNTNALDILIEEARSTLRSWGSQEPSFLLTNPKLTMQMTMTPEKTSYVAHGPEGQKLLKQGPSLPSYRGLNIINSRCFATEEGKRPRDMLDRRVRVAEYYVVSNVPCDDSGKANSRGRLRGAVRPVKRPDVQADNEAALRRVILARRQDEFLHQLQVTWMLSLGTLRYTWNRAADCTLLGTWIRRESLIEENPAFH